MTGPAPPLRIAVLLNGALRNDARVLNVVRSLSRIGRVDVYYAGGDASDAELVPPNVGLYRSPTPHGWRSRVLRHSLVHLEYAGLHDRVIDSGSSYDVIHANDFPTLYPAHRLARRFRAKLVYDAHEIYMETLNQQFPTDARGLRGLAFRALLGCMRLAGWKTEARLARRVDLLLTVSGSFAQFFRARYGVANTHVVMNCPELGVYPRTRRIQERLDLPLGTPVVLYQGVLNAGRGLERLVECAMHLTPPTVLVILGYGPLSAPLQAFTARLGLQRRVLFIPAIPYEELLSYTASADVGVLLTEPINLSKALTLANKVFQYMAASLPLVLSRSSEHDRLLTEVGCGVAPPSLAPADIAAAINDVIHHQERSREMARRGREAFERTYNWERQGEILVSAYRDLVART